MNLDAYRFSISWSRVLPSKLVPCINLGYYINLVGGWDQFEGALIKFNY